MTSRRSGIVKQAGRFKKAAGPVGLALVLAATGLGLALAAAPAEAGGPGYRGYGHGSHGHRSGSVGYRGYGRYYGSQGSFGHHSFGSRYPYGRTYGSHRYGGHPSRHDSYSSHYRSYRHVYPYTSYSFGYRYYPQPIYYYPPTYGGAYVDDGAVADPGGYLPIQQPVSSPPQPIYIVVQPPADSSASEGGYPPANPAPTYGAPEIRQPSAPADDRPGQVLLSVEPSNAAVYLDDDLLGSGDSLAELSEPLVVSAGVHVLEVLHPDHEPQRLFFGMPAAGRLQIDFDLEGDRRGRKARMKSLDRGVVER